MEQIAKISALLYSQITEGLLQIWRFELFSVDNAPISLGKIIAALFFVFLGITLSRLLSTRVVHRLGRRAHVTPSHLATIERVLFYVLSSISIVIALNLVHIPLTAVTLLGGAIALGVGFGSQNIMNNFMSGLIILFEQPLRVGDTVQFDSAQGVVRKIGGRSTIIRTGEGLDIVVPNSLLIERQLTNWTLTDDVVRKTIKVGVGYSSATRDVERILLEIAGENALVLQTPPPQVAFTDFADSALSFELRFWITLKSQAEAVNIESELRHSIVARFAQEKIEIPFPKRDVVLRNES